MVVNIVVMPLQNLLLNITRDINIVGRRIIICLSLWMTFDHKEMVFESLLLEYTILSLVHYILKLFIVILCLVGIIKVQRERITINGSFFVLPNFTVSKKTWIIVTWTQHNLDISSTTSLLYPPMYSFIIMYSYNKRLFCKIKYLAFSLS